jgi:hypothetical protein
VKPQPINELLVAGRVFNFESSYSGRWRDEEIGGTMKSQLKFAWLLALGMGVLSAGAAAQERQVHLGDNVRVQYATLNPAQAVGLQTVGWNDHRRCDGDHDRDDRGCYYQYRNGYRYPAYYGNGYYGYYATPAPYYSPGRGWYDRNGRWHAYDRDRDQDRRRHDDDDRR